MWKGGAKLGEMMDRERSGGYVLYLERMRVVGVVVCVEQVGVE